MNSYSQAGQDAYVYSKLPKTDGIFIDIGCGSNELSNTLALEEIGWRGVLLDITKPDGIETRKSKFIQADAKTFDWKKELADYPKVIDYLSLDVDSESFDALKNILSCGHKFQVITSEHDAYRFGDKLRAPMRELLLQHGYQLDKPNVSNVGCEFEDWWVLP